jgi:DNA polymerase III subunit epsilon
VKPVTELHLPAWARQLAVFDTETTGIAPETTRIVQAHVSLLDHTGSVVEGRDWLIDCGIDIPEQATRVHGITTERMRAEGAPAAESIQEIVAYLGEFFAQGVAVVAYNASYDFTILDREAKRYELTPLDRPRPIVDPLVIDRQLDKYRKGVRNLVANAELYGVILENAHDASADAIAAGRVAQAIAAKYFDQLDIPALDLHVRQEEWALEQAASYRRYRESIGKPMYDDNDAWPVG